MPERISTRRELQRKEVQQALKDGACFAAASSVSMAAIITTGFVLYRLLDKSLDKNITPPSFYRHSSIQTGNTDIHFTGVTHNTETFLEHEAEIATTIKASSAVVLEYFDPEYMKLSTPNISNDQLISATSINKDLGFFNGIGRTCAEYSKDIFVVNPQNNNQFLELLELYPLLGILPALMLTDFANFIKRGLGRDVSRRHTLRTAGYLINAATLASYAELGVEIYRESFQDNPNPERNNVNPLFRWNLVDFRDVKSGLGIRKIIESNNGNLEDGLLVIQGDGHTKGTIKYLQNPRQAGIKRWLYPHFEIFSKPIQHYHYDPENNHWGKVDSLTLK